MNAYIKTKNIELLINSAFDEYNELKSYLMNKEISFELDLWDDEVNSDIHSTGTGTVTYMSFYDYELTICVTTHEGQEYYLSSTDKFEVIK